MGAASRRKGLTGEREVADVFERHGFAVRGLESSGDWICVPANGVLPSTLHVEAKRAERLRVPEWVHQAETEAMPGHVPVVAYRQNREPWRAIVQLEQLLGLIR
jgi:Holliday junction resolvase